MPDQATSSLNEFSLGAQGRFLSFNSVQSPISSAWLQALLGRKSPESLLNNLWNRSGTKSSGPK